MFNSQIKQMAATLSSPMSSSDTQTNPTTPAGHYQPPQNQSGQLETQGKYQFNKQQKHQQYKFNNKQFSHDSSSSQDCQNNQAQGLGQDMSQNCTQRLNNTFSSECLPTQQQKFANYSQQGAVVPLDLLGLRHNPNNSFFQKKNNKYTPQNINQLQQSRVYSGYPSQSFQRQESSKDIDKLSENSTNQRQDEPQRQQQKQYYKYKKYPRQQNDQSFEEDSNNSNNSRERQPFGDRNNNNDFKNESHDGKIMNKMNDSRSFFTPNNQRKNHLQQPSLQPAPPQGYTNQSIQPNDPSQQATNNQSQHPYPNHLQNQTQSNFHQKNAQPIPPSPPISCNQEKIVYPQNQLLPLLPLPIPYPSIEPSSVNLLKANAVGNDIENILIDKKLLKQIFTSAIDEKLDTLRDEMRSLFEGLSLAAQTNNSTSQTTQNEKSFLQSENLSDLHAEAVELKNPDRERIRSPNKNQGDSLRQQSLDIKKMSPSSEKQLEKNKKKKTKRLREK